MYRSLSFASRFSFASTHRIFPKILHWAVPAWTDWGKIFFPFTLQATSVAFRFKLSGNLSSFCGMVSKKVKRQLRKRMGHIGRSIRKNYNAWLWHLDDLLHSPLHHFDRWELSDSGDERFCGGCLQIMDPVTTHIGGPVVRPREWTCHHCD